MSNTLSSIVCVRMHSHFASYYSQTCVQRPPLGPKNSGRCWQVVVVQRCNKVQLWSSKRWSLWAGGSYSEVVVSSLDCTSRTFWMVVTRARKKNTSERFVSLKTCCYFYYTMFSKQLPWYLLRFSNQCNIFENILNFSDKSEKEN